MREQAKKVDSQFYLSDKNGNIKFTRTGLEHLTPLFELADIDINRIKTLQDYRRARKEASPFFTRHLSDKADSWPDTDQFRLLKAVLFGDKDDIKQEIERFDTRKKLQIIK